MEEISFIFESPLVMPSTQTKVFDMGIKKPYRDIIRSGVKEQQVIDYERFGKFSNIIRVKIFTGKLQGF